MTDPLDPRAADSHLLIETHKAVKQIQQALLGSIETGQVGLIETTRDHGRRILHAEERLEGHSIKLHDLGNQLQNVINENFKRKLAEAEEQLRTVRGVGLWAGRTIAEKVIAAAVAAALVAAGAAATRLF